MYTEHTTYSHANNENNTEEEFVSACIEHGEEENVTTPNVELSEENLTNNPDKVYRQI